MTIVLHRYDITHEDDFHGMPDFNRKTVLQHVDKTYKAEITNIIHLTEMEKLFRDEQKRETDILHSGEFANRVGAQAYRFLPRRWMPAYVRWRRAHRCCRLQRWAH